MISQFFSIVMTGNIMAVVANEFPERLTTFDSLDSDSDIWTPLDSDNDIDGNPRLHWFSLRSVICQEISRHSRDKLDANLNHGSVTRVFPRFR